MKKMAVVMMVIGIFIFTQSAFAAVIFQDDFNSENGSHWKLDYSGFANWVVSDGTVDLIGLGSSYNYYPGNGLFVDLDGSTGNAGKMTTKTTFGTGWYSLQFDLAGCYVRQQNNTVTVSMGNYIESITLSQFSPLTTYTRSVYVSSPSSMNLIFNHSGGDNVGLILDNVKVSTIPEPATVSLLGVGLLSLLGFSRRKRT